MPFFNIDCPCECGRTIPIIITPKDDESSTLLDESSIPLVAEIIWQQLVSENGIEGAVELLHENCDVMRAPIVIE